MKLSVAVFSCLLLITGCEPTPDSLQRDAAHPLKINDTGRFDVQRVQVFVDSLAYNDKRGVYIISDKETGTTYVGVSGIGISELGSHSSGKSQTKDER